jgi:hypothetical protein
MSDDNEEFELMPDLNTVIKKIREIIKYFRRSPVKNDSLEKYIADEFGGTGMSLILDCRTRWNSLFLMIQRYIKVQKHVSKALLDFPSDDIEDLSSMELSLLKDILACLEPVKVSVEALCRQDVDLVQAEVILKFMFEELRKHGSQLAAELSLELEAKLQERRNKDLVTLLMYLQDCNNVQREETLKLF